MLKLLIVDDNDVELHGLAAMINTFDFPIDICATARSGKEGLQKAAVYKPDIVLTDLRMPQMDGIEMISLMKQERPESQVVLISGFEDFKAAREAIALEILAYLLKPVNREELYNVLLKCCSFTDADALLADRLSKKSRISLFSFEEENLARQLLFHVTGETSLSLIDQQDNPLTSGRRFSVVTVDIYQESGNDALLYFHHLQGFAKQTNALAPILVDANKAAIIFHAPSFVDESSFIDNLANNAEQIVSLLEQLNLPAITVGISDITEDPSLIPVLLQQSFTAIEERFYNNKRNVLFYEDKKVASPCFYSSENTNQPANLILSLDEAGLSDFCRSFFETIGHDPQEEIRNQTMEMMSFALTALRKANIEFERQINEKGLPYTTLGHKKTLAGLQDYVTSYFLNLMKIAHRLSEEQSTKTITRICNIIRQEYNTPLSIDYLAEKLYLSPSHLRRLFKNKTGLTVLDYIENVRMDMACQLLSQIKYRIHEIGGMIGYENASYFNLVFKKHFNMTPGEYRKSVVDTEVDPAMSVPVSKNGLSGNVMKGERV